MDLLVRHCLLKGQKNSQEGFKNLFFKIKICDEVLFKNFAFASLLRNEVGSEQNNLGSTTLPTSTTSGTRR